MKLKGGGSYRGTNHVDTMAHAILRWQREREERDKHINQGDRNMHNRSLLPTLSHSLPLRKRKHLEPLRNVAPKSGAQRVGKGHGGEGCQQSLISGGINVSELCALGKFIYFTSLRQDPFTWYWGRGERGHRAEKAAGFFPRSDLGTQGFTYIGIGHETQSQQDHQSYYHSIRVRPQHKGFTVTRKENGLPASCPSLGD